MRPFVFIFFAILAMAAAQQVNVVEDSGVPSGGNGDRVVIANPDPFFSQPSKGPNNGYEPISTGPAFVDFQNKPYPYKQYDHPGARGGK